MILLVVFALLIDDIDFDKVFDIALFGFKVISFFGNI